MTNAQRFLNAYNTLDHSLRTQYNFKRTIAFSDVIRRSVMLNSVIRKYEDDLIDYGRLRNAIVHSGNEQEIIAEPNTNVVEKLEKIAQIVSTPPKVLDSVCTKDVLCVDGKSTLEKTMGLIWKSGYSNLPVYLDGTLIGVANGQRLMDILGEVAYKKGNLSEFCKNTKICDIISKLKSEMYFEVHSQELTIEQAMNLFYKNRKLLVVLITKNGSEKEKPLGIVSVSDIIDINNILENY